MASSYETLSGAPGSHTRRAWPRLGDLVLDTVRHNRIGVIVGIPGEQGSQWLTYQLQPLGGGTDWSAPADASTLRPLPPRITHATCADSSLVYRHEDRNWTLEIRCHLDDGNSGASVLILAEDQAQRLASASQVPVRTDR